jgi:hypothetical protein
MTFSKLGLILSLSYLGIFLVSGVYAIYLLLFHTATSEFSGLLGILVTLPWSLMFTPILDSIGYITWYESFSGNAAVYGIFAMLGLLPGALINATILYFIGRLFGGAVKSEHVVSSEVGTEVSFEKVELLWTRFNIFFWLVFLLSIASFALIFLPTQPLIQYIGATIAARMITKFAGVVLLSYFGYAITGKKSYLFLGLLGFFPFFTAIGLVIGYLVLWYAKKNLMRSSL